MTKYILPFTEVNSGWYEIEANNLEHARQLVEDTDYVMDLEPFYKGGETYWETEELQEETTN
jgi:hypothetical protein